MSNISTTTDTPISVENTNKVDKVPEAPDGSVRPPHQFKIGDIVVKYSRPNKALRIWQEPRWNNWTVGSDQWMYDYEYGLGGSSEGSALESELRLAPNNSCI